MNTVLSAKDLYRVEISRLVLAIEESGLANVDLSQYSYVDHIEKYGDNFYDAESDYAVREIDGELYRFDYNASGRNEKNITLMVNLTLGFMSAIVIGLLLYFRRKIILPFDRLENVPYELSKGNLTPAIKESKNHFFGKFNQN